MSNYTLEGYVKHIGTTQTFGQGFTKREIAVTVSKGSDDKYPQHIKLTLVKDKVALADQIELGQRVRVSFDLRGNEHNGRYYTDLQAWKIEAENGTPQPAAQPAKPLPTRPAPVAAEQEDDAPLPF